MPAGTTHVHRTGSGPRLVLLHCLGVDHHMWDETIQRLGDGFEILRYDLPGHGTTAVPDTIYDIADLSAQLSTLLDSEKVDRAHVAGISLGGLVAQHFAATYPEKVDRLVLIDTTPRYTDELRQMWVQRAHVARLEGVQALIEPLMKIWFTDAFVMADSAPVRYARATLARTSGEAYARACEVLAGADLEPLVPRICAPTLVVCGDDDIPSFRDAARWLASEIDGASLAWLSNARHASILEQPDAFCTLLEDFLR